MRKLFVVLTVVLIVAGLSVSAFAATVTKPIYTSGDQQRDEYIVRSFSFPVSQAVSYLVYYDQYGVESGEQTVNGAYVTPYYSSSTFYSSRMQTFLFGDGNVMPVSEIVGTDGYIRLLLRYSASFEYLEEDVICYLGIRWYDADGIFFDFSNTFLFEVEGTVDGGSGYYEVTSEKFEINISPVDDAAYFSLYVYFAGAQSDRSGYDWVMQYETLTLWNHTAYSADEADKLDQIVNGSVDPQLPDGAGDVNDYEDLESGLVDDAVDGFGVGADYVDDVRSIFDNFSSGFLAISWVMGLAIQIPFIQSLLTISLSFGVYLVIFSVAMSVVNRASRQSGSTSKSKGGNP